MYKVLSEKGRNNILSDIKVHLDLEKQMFKTKPDFKSPVTMTINEDGEKAEKFPIISFVDHTISLQTIKLHDITRVNAKFKGMHDLFEALCRRFLLLLEFEAKKLQSTGILLRTKEDILVEIASEKGYTIDIADTCKGKMYELFKNIKLIEG